MEGCLARDLREGRREPPGGCIFEDQHLRVEHCIGPLGVGSLDLAEVSDEVDLLAERFGTKTRYNDGDAATEIQAAPGVEAIGA